MLKVVNIVSLHSGQAQMKLTQLNQSIPEESMDVSILVLRFGQLQKNWELPKTNGEVQRISLIIMVLFHLVPNNISETLQWLQL